MKETTDISDLEIETITITPQYDGKLIAMVDARYRNERDTWYNYTFEVTVIQKGYCGTVSTFIRRVR